jgi:hypothetical protein
MDTLTNLDYSRVEIAVAARPHKKGDSPLFYAHVIARSEATWQSHACGASSHEIATLRSR